MSLAALALLSNELPVVNEVDWADPIDAALSHAARDCHVFRLSPQGKTPISAWRDEATTSGEQIVAWWAGSDRYNIGIACGPSGLVVVDEDILGALDEYAA